MKTWLLVLLAVATAICTWLSTAPLGNSIAAFAAPCLLIIIALHARTTRSAIFWVLVMQIPLWIWLHRWVGDIAFAGWIGLGIYMSIWAPLFVYLLRRVERSKCLPFLSTIFVAPIIWVGLECLRGIVIFDGYPWYLAGTGVVDSIFARFAAYGSVWGVSFFVVMLAAVVATIKQVTPKTWIALVLFTVWLARYGTYDLMLQNPPIPIAVIQTNVPQSNKIRWTWEQQQVDVDKAIQLTYEAVEQAEKKPQLIVWPETMLPGTGFEVSRFDYEPWAEDLRRHWYFAERLRHLAEEIDIPILVGSQTLVDVTVIREDNYYRLDLASHYNSAVLIHPDGQTERYDKIFLTPFGERIPYVEHWPALQTWVRETFGAAMLFDLDHGGDPTRLALKVIYDDGYDDEIRIGTPICFEDTVPRVVRDIVWDNGEKQVDILINLSNDGWFGNVDHARLQHIREARMRCIENQTPMIRVANTGMSCYISRQGLVTQYIMDGDSLAFRKPAILHTFINRNPEQPLSASVGDSVAWGSLFASILLILGSFKKRSSEHETITN